LQENLAFSQNSAKKQYNLSMRILVVEDEHKIAQSIKKGLEQESLAVDLSFDGNNGFDLASTEDYDVIILDILLPGMSGIEICSALREKKIHTPILLLTAKGQVADKVEGLNSGADDYMTKPFAFEELLARINALARRPQDSLGTILKVGELSLNTVSFEVKKGTREIRLSSKEFALLDYLMRHPNQIISKEQIISHIWDYDADVLPNTVEVYIGYLRKKVGSDLIKTIRGFGYKLG